MKNTSLITINEHPLSKKDFMDAVEQEIIYLHDTGDLNHTMRVLSGLENVEGVTGHMKARLLWASEEWFKQNNPDQNFLDHVTSTTEIPKVTVTRYIRVQRYIEDYTIPKELHERPMRDLVPIASTLAQGFDISKEQWRKIKNTTSSGELSEVLRDVKGTQPKKNTKVLKMTRDGTINLWINNEKKFVGYLDLSSEDKDVQNAIEKIKIAANLIEE